MLNKQGKGKIDWTDYTWNAVSGCYHNCPYCYMQRLVERKIFDMTPKFHEKRLNDLKSAKNPSKIFVCSSGDLFGAWVPKFWIEEVLKKTLEFPQHTFQFLTKNPKRYQQFFFRKNCWLGTTIDGKEKTIVNLNYLKAIPLENNIKFISFEPLLKEIKPDLTGIDWVIIGANSNEGAEKPKKEWADNLINAARKLKIPIWIKNNYGYPEEIKEMPKCHQ